MKMNVTKKVANFLVEPQHAYLNDTISDRLERELATTQLAPVCETVIARNAVC